MKSRLFALIDCNNFFVSCERVFQPSLEKKPVLVLSSNDGCVISRSNEAKALGIPMGIPFFKVHNLIRQNKVHTFSSNFSLYRDMSWRVMESLRAFSRSIEIYSIDEAFLDVPLLPEDELLVYGCSLKQQVKQWTGIPVSVGIGPTKTLAKIAAHFAKSHPTGCYTLTTPQKTTAVLKTLPSQGIWGVGRKSTKKLSLLGVNTALDLAQADVRWITQAFNIVLARTVLELRGMSCLRLEDVSSPKKSMISSRSFGAPISSFEVLSEAVSFHASSLAQKLRKQKSKASYLSVSIQTNPFDKAQSFYANTHSIPLPLPTHDTSLLIKAALAALKVIFKEGLSYKKAGVMVFDLFQEDQVQLSLFTESKFEATANRNELFKAIDTINHRHGTKTLFFASEGISQKWRPHSFKRSPSYTQNWDQLREVS